MSPRRRLLSRAALQEDPSLSNVESRKGIAAATQTTLIARYEMSPTVGPPRNLAAKTRKVADSARNLRSHPHLGAQGPTGATEWEEPSKALQQRPPSSIENPRHGLRLAASGTSK